MPLANTPSKAIIAYNAEEAIIKKANGDLIAFRFADLSEADREFLESKESADMVRTQANRLQNWTFRGGYRAAGRLVDYIRKDVTLVRKRGRVYVNDGHWIICPRSTRSSYAGSYRTTKKFRLRPTGMSTSG